MMASPRFGEDKAATDSSLAASIGWVVSDESFAHSLQRFMNLKLRARATARRVIRASATSLPAPSRAARRTAARLEVRYRSSATPTSAGSTTRELNTGADMLFFNGRAEPHGGHYYPEDGGPPRAAPDPLDDRVHHVLGRHRQRREQGPRLRPQHDEHRHGRNRRLTRRTVLTMTFNRVSVARRCSTTSRSRRGISGVATTSICAGRQAVGASCYHAVSTASIRGIPATRDPARRRRRCSEITSSRPHDRREPPGELLRRLHQYVHAQELRAEHVPAVQPGNDVFNMMRISRRRRRCTYDNKFTDVLRRWQKPGDITDVPRMSYDCASGADAISEPVHRNGSYLHVQEITLGWRVPSRLAAKAKARQRAPVRLRPQPRRSRSTRATTPT